MCRPWQDIVRAVLCRGSQRERRRLWARFTQRHASSLGATVKVQIIPEIYYQRLRVPQFKKNTDGESAKAKRRGERKTTEMMQNLNKRGRRNPLEKWSAWQGKSPSPYQHDVVVADPTLWLEWATTASQHESWRFFYAAGRRWNWTPYFRGRSYKNEARRAKCQTLTG